MTREASAVKTSVRAGATLHTAPMPDMVGSDDGHDTVARVLDELQILRSAYI
jgi:hypothetical protein